MCDELMWKYISQTSTLFDKSVFPTGSVKMFRNLSLTFFVIDHKKCP